MSDPKTGTGHRSEKVPSNLGQVVVATEVTTSGPNRRQARNVILLLAASVGLMMTGFGIIFPVFARRLGELGSGVEALGLMTMSFALAQFVAAPIMGSLADRYGRRPLVLLGLSAFFVANIGFLFANSITAFVVIRVFEGALTAGLFPAAMGVVADVVPRNQRARWVGVIMGSYGAGLIFGPVIGGFLYDTSGYAAPFVASAVMALIALVAAVITMPETRTPEVRWREELRNRRASAIASTEGATFWDSLPRPIYLFATLLFLDFVLVFAFAFVEPQMVFYFYDDLGWTSIQFGLVIGVYGITMVLGQAFLGPLSDKYGRKSVIVTGTVVETVFYAGLIFLTSFPMMIIAAAISGLGTALIEPALNSYYLDITDERYRSRILGIKESSVALGGVAGPMLLILISGSIAAKGIFTIAALIVLASAILAAIVLPAQDQTAEEPGSLAWETSEKRALAAQSAVRGIVLRASTTRSTTISTYTGQPSGRLSMETIPLPTRNKGQASEMLARAFHEDPLYQHIFPDDYERVRSLERLFSAVVRYSLRYGQVQTTPSLEGAACWLTPNNTEVTFWRMLRTGLAFQRAVGRMPAVIRQELLDALAFTDTIHKRLMAGPHWYLWALGVDPDHQGRGIGGQLIRPALTQADDAGLPCYLETLNESNLAFYQKWGFEVREEETVPELGLPVWAMVRQPRP